MLPNVWGYLLGLRAWCGSNWGAESAAYVPWILDGTSLAERERFLAAFPPIRLINRLLWEAPYRQRHLWGTEGST